MPTQCQPCVLFALRRERSAICRTFRPQRPLTGAPNWAYFCSTSQSQILVVETGVGPKNTALTLDWLFARPHQPSHVLMAGFCGALRPQYKVGDVVCASEIIGANHELYPITWPNARTRGRVFTVSRLITDPREKARLAEEYDADVVDMESAIVAEHCRDAGIPFGCLRAVSDDRETALSPELVSLLSGGRVSFTKTLTALARRPRMIVEMLRLARNTRLAANRLAQALTELLSGSGVGVC